MRNIIIGVLLGVATSGVLVTTTFSAEPLEEPDNVISTASFRVTDHPVVERAFWIACGWAYGVMQPGRGCR